jgi:hypothetical protein
MADSCIVTQEFTSLYEIQRFITVFITAFFWSLSCGRSIQPIPFHIPLKYILILSTLAFLVHRSVLFSSGYAINTLHTNHEALHYGAFSTLPLLFTPSV